MEIHSIEISDTQLLSRAAGVTQGKDNIGAVTPAMFERFLRSEHKPICCVRVVIDATVPKSVASHFRTHDHKLDFIQTSRPDLTGKDRDGSEEVRYLIVCNPQTLVNIARKRLCSKSEKNTLDFCAEIEYRARKSANRYLQILSEYMVPNCQYRGGCTEIKSCGMMEPLQ